MLGLLILCVHVPGTADQHSLKAGFFWCYIAARSAIELMLFVSNTQD